MKILRLQTTGFKRITAVDITPDGALVRVGGDNGEGKSSLLDSIMAALGGASAAPIKPIRTGDDYAAIRVELGDGEPAIIVEKYFDEVGEKLRVTNGEGAEYKAGQGKVADLLGRMTFDPLAFSRLKPDAQAIELRRLVPLKVDLDALAKADAADVIVRRDVNREGKQAVARRDAINVSGIIPPRPDRDAIVAALGGAGETNAAIERERASREEKQRTITARNNKVGDLVSERDRIEERLKAIADEIALLKRGTEERAAELLALPPLDEPVDTAKLSADLAQADADLALLARVDERKRLDDEVEALRHRSAAYTGAMADRAELRAKALAEAEMPVPGLSLARLCDAIPGEESTDLIVVYEGEPFSQASGAQQLRVSMRLAMAANPRLRVMLIKEGSLLDPKGLELVRDLATEGGYQVWLETVGEGDGTGIIMEAGAVRGAPEPERLDPPKRRKAKVEGDGESAVSSTRDAEPGELVDAPLPRTSGYPAADPAATPTRRKPTAMREFTSKPAGDLFGGGE